MYYAVAYLGFHFGGVQNIFVKVGVFACRSHAFVRVVPGACPGIRKGGWGPKSESLFFFFFFAF